MTAQNENRDAKSNAPSDSFAEYAQTPNPFASTFAEYAKYLDFSNVDDFVLESDCELARFESAPVVPTDVFSTFRLCFEKFGDFSGRAGRAEFWLFAAALGSLNGVFAILAFLALSLGPLGFAPLYLVGLAWIFADFFATIPTFAVAARRLHDRNLTARFRLAAPVVAAAIGILALWALSEGEASPILRAVAVGAPLVVLGLGAWLLVLFAGPGDPKTNRFGAAPRRD